MFRSGFLLIPLVLSFLLPSTALSAEGEAEDDGGESGAQEAGVAPLAPALFLLEVGGTAGLWGGFYVAYSGLVGGRGLYVRFGARHGIGGLFRSGALAYDTQGEIGWQGLFRTRRGITPDVGVTFMGGYMLASMRNGDRENARFGVMGGRVLLGLLFGRTPKGNLGVQFGLGGSSAFHLDASDMLNGDLSTSFFRADLAFTATM